VGDAGLGRVGDEQVRVVVLAVDFQQPGFEVLTDAAHGSFQGGPGAVGYHSAAGAW
jgi:hypothetical protein